MSSERGYARSFSRDSRCARVAMSDKRILLVLSNAPAPFGNAAARWYYVLLKGLSARGYRVTAFAASANLHEVEEARQLPPAPDYDLRCYPFPPRTRLA